MRTPEWRCGVVEVAGFWLIRSLSAGGFGEVHLGQFDAGRRAAVKLLHLPNDSNIRRFYREAKILHQQLSNPHVVDLIACDFNANPPYVVMEFCTEGSLREWVGKMPAWQSVAMALVHVLDGLAGIHALGGFHRDLKPDNLLLTKLAGVGAVVKLGDFGLARIPLSSTHPMTRTARGTEDDIAPEVYRGADFDQRCDVYSLGVTFIELLTGDRSPASLPTRPDLPHELRQVLLAMASPEPIGRPTVAECKAAVVGIRERQPRIPASPQSEKKSGAGAALAGAAVALLGALAIGTMNTKDANGRWRGKDGRFRSGPWG